MMQPCLNPTCMPSLCNPFFSGTVGRADSCCITSLVPATVLRRQGLTPRHQRYGMRGRADSCCITSLTPAAVLRRYYREGLSIADALDICKKCIAEIRVTSPFSILLRVSCVPRASCLLPPLMVAEVTLRPSPLVSGLFSLSSARSAPLLPLWSARLCAGFLRRLLSPPAHFSKWEGSDEQQHAALPPVVDTAAHTENVLQERFLADTGVYIVKICDKVRWKGSGVLRARKVVERSARKGGVSEQERSVQCEVPRQTGRLTRPICAPPQGGNQIDAMSVALHARP